MMHAEYSDVVPASALVTLEPNLSSSYHWNRMIHLVDAKPACFRSETRMGCKDHECQCRRDCLKLVAEWRR